MTKNNACTIGAQRNWPRGELRERSALSGEEPFSS